MKRPVILSEENSVKSLDLRLLLRLFAFTRPYAKQRNILIGLVIVRSIQLPLLAWMTGAIINEVLIKGSAGMLLWSCLGFLAFAAFTDLTFGFRMLLSQNLGESVIRDLRTTLFRHMQSMRLGYFHRTKLGRTISRFTSDAEAVRSGVQDVLFVSIVQGGQMIVSAILMAVYDWMLFLVILGLVPIYWGINRYFAKRLSTAHREVQESFSRITSNLAESVNGIRVTQGFVRQDVNSATFAGLVQDHARYNKNVARTSGTFVPLLEMNSQVFIAILLVLGGYQVLHTESTVSVGDLIQFFFLASLFFSPIQSLANQYNNALNALAGAERIFQFLDTPQDWTEPENLAPMARVKGHVEFRDVHFAYNPERVALRGVSFQAEPGQCVAFVGHTGSGKSSMINLLAKFYLPNQGSVLVDGRDLLSVPAKSYQSQLGMVLQQNFLFSGSILENIRFPRPSASREEVRAAADSIGCLDLLEQLPEGLDTQVGERGGGLSLGQRQLVCFARAMLADPRMIILDEATSSIDAMTELRLQDALGKLLKGRTSFLVAHRLSTVRKADLILVLNQGLIEERGRHDELLKQGGIYAGLYRQFLKATTD